MLHITGKLPAPLGWTGQALEQRDPCWSPGIWGVGIPSSSDSKERGGRTICKTGRLALFVFFFFFFLSSTCLKLSNNFSSPDLRAKLFSEHAGCCSRAATAAALVTPARATFSARSPAQPPRSGASGRPPPPTRAFSGLGLGVSPLCFVRERLFFQGTTNLGGELPYGPPGEAAHGGEAI